MTTEAPTPHPPSLPHPHLPPRHHSSKTGGAFLENEYLTGAQPVFRSIMTPCLATVDSHAMRLRPVSDPAWQNLAKSQCNLLAVHMKAAEFAAKTVRAVGQGDGAREAVGQCV